MSQDTSSKNFKSLFPWMSFHGWVYIIFGVFSCLSVVGVIIGVPLIVAGASLASAGGDFKRYSLSGNPLELESAVKEQKKFFMISGLLLLITVVLPFILGLSFALSLLFNPAMNGEFDELMEKVPQIQKQIPYEFGKGREV
ncbi:MAG: DUF5362 family protein [Candidatus Caenarcaniphilales bacterium]|nr:DUF5362 family protein [Candidatus Caenarcaniphilales bacterium]